MNAPFLGVIGAGSWGTALAVHLANCGSHIRLWGNDLPHLEQMARDRTNTKYLPGVPLPDNVEPVFDPAQLREAEALIVVPPSKAMRDVASRLVELDLPPAIPLLSCTKGIEFHTGLRMSQILAENLPTHPVAVLSGPSHAEEVARFAPTAVVIGCENALVTGRLQRRFSSPTFRAYSSTDVAGIELGGALKNVFAIAAGVGDGLGLGDNSKAALVTRSMVEMIRLGTCMGGNRETFMGLSGIGDLMVTCFSRHGRNRAVGERLGRGETLEAIAASTPMVAEGVPATLSAFEQARRFELSTPIIDGMQALLFDGVAPKEAMMQLLSRSLRAESDS